MMRLAVLLLFIPAICLAGSGYQPPGGATNADALNYTPTTSSNWSPAPTDSGPALDQLASRVSTVETGKQPLDATLTAYSGGTCSSDTLLYCSGSDVVSSATFTAAGRALVDDVDAAAQRTTLGLGSMATQASTAYLAVANNLSDLSSASTARTNLGLGTAATAASTTFLQVANNLSDVTASTARTNLGLGTAATTSAADYQPVDATLTAFAGATCAASTLLYCSGSDAVSGATLTSAGLALLDDASAGAQRTTLGLGTAATSAITDFQPAIPADSWTYSWVAADGDPTGLGWSSSGSVAITVASTTQGGVACYSLTPSASSGTAFIKKSTTASAGNWELRLKVYLPVSASTNQNFGFTYSPDATVTGTKRYQYMLTATGIQSWTGAAMASLVTVPDLTGRWLDVTVRNYVSTTGLANAWQQIWVGGVLVYNAQGPTTLGAASVAAGDITVGRLTAGTTQSVIYIAAVLFKDGVNQLTPAETFRSSTWPL